MPAFFVLTALGIIPLIGLWYFTTDTPRQSKRVNELELAHIEAGLQKEAEEEAKKSLDKGGFWDNVKVFATNYRFWLLVVYYVVHTSVLWGSMTWLPSYLKDARGFSWAAMGVLSSLPFVMMLLAKIASGIICDKIGRQAPLLLSAMIGVGIGVYFGANAVNNWMAAMYLTIGIGALGLGGPAAWTLLQNLVPSKGVSTGAGVMNGMGNGLSSLAPLAIGLFISITGSYVGGLLYLVGCCVVGGVATLILTLQKY